MDQTNGDTGDSSPQQDHTNGGTTPISSAHPTQRNIGKASARDFAALLSGPMLNVYVGPDKRHWMLHENLLCHHSPYIDSKVINSEPNRKEVRKATNGELKHNEDVKVVNGDSKQKENGKLELLDEDPTAFELLIKWLYQGKIEDVTKLPQEEKWDYAYTCQKLYLLCEKIGIQDLKNQAIDQFRKGCHEAGLVPGPEEMRPIYSRTAQSSPFRKLVSRIAARQIMDPETEKDATTYRSCFETSPDFAVDVINAIKDGTGGALFDDPTEGNSCRYHEHDDGQSCHKTVKFKDGS